MSDVAPGKFPPGFWSYLQTHPSQTVSAIIRVESLSPEVEQAVVGAGCLIKRQLKLLPSLAVEAPGRVLMALSAEPWVLRIEPDQTMRVL